MNTKTVLSVLIATVLLSACGNKGPLVMPQKPVPVEQEVPAPSAPAADPVQADPTADPLDPEAVPTDDGDG